MPINRKEATALTAISPHRTTVIQKTEQNSLICA